jgi:exosortase/archaeosortase
MKHNTYLACKRLIFLDEANIPSLISLLLLDVAFEKGDNIISLQLTMVDISFMTLVVLPFLPLDPEAKTITTSCTARHSITTWWMHIICVSVHDEMHHCTVPATMILL